MVVAKPFDIVRWTLAAFDGSEDASDGRIVEILRGAGLPRAGHAVAMVPLAYGRQMLQGLVEVPATYVELDRGGARRREAALDDDPIFAAASQIARAEATKADGHVALRSAEVRAVNQALQGGSQPGDLVLSPPMLCLDDGEGPAVPVAPDTQALVDELVRAHGADLALATRVTPYVLVAGRVQLQLDVAVRVGGRWCFEAFSGTGATIHAAITEATEKLAGGTLHVMLAVLVDRALGRDQVEWETWGDFEVCHGPFVQRGEGDAPPRFHDYLGAIRAALVAAPPSSEVHWLHTFVARNGEALAGCEMRLDNEPWPPGVAIVESWPWPRSTGLYTFRHFCMLMPRHDN
jgi:hypothetical protein